MRLPIPPRLLIALLVAGVAPFVSSTAVADATTTRTSTAPDARLGTIPPEVLNVVTGLRVQDLRGPVEWVETTSSAAEFGSREAKGLPDVPVYMIQCIGDFTVQGPMFDGRLTEPAHHTVGWTIVPVSPSELGFYGGGGLNSFPPRDLSTLGHVHRVELSAIREMQPVSHR